MLRKILGVLAGILIAGVTVGIVEGIGHQIYPPPADIDLKNAEDMKQLMSVIPFGAKLSVVIAWFLGAFVGAFVALKITNWAPAGWIVAAFIIAGGIYTMTLFPHPVWMMACGVLLPLVAAFLASRIALARS